MIVLVSMPGEMERGQAVNGVNTESSWTLFTSLKMAIYIIQPLKVSLLPLIVAILEHDDLCVHTQEIGC